MILPEEFKRTAVVAVDLQNDCIEPDGAWPIYNRDELLRGAKIVLDASRAAGLPIIYTQHWLDPRGVDALHLDLRSDGRPKHGIADTPAAEIHINLKPEAQDLLVRKQRFSAFYNTNLELLLRRLDVDHLIMFGAWTEACFETTVWDAIWRDYRITIVKDACGTLTELMHMTAILDLANWLYAGSVITSDNLKKALEGAPHKAWRFETPSAFAYTLDNVRALYNSL
ncbi:cysteine hydrolase family protein [Ensifer sp. BR816]|uniref:cysteine hydrolase family protein n=1 Tax=Rhizobium sp. (strain BR816) TaxID=1057002 RepID=UPI000367CA25|nr:isochorismatase family cysteine hydrolase [Ensifer sp. BR816]